MIVLKKTHTVEEVRFFSPNHFVLCQNIPNGKNQHVLIEKFLNKTHFDNMENKVRNW